MNPKLVQKQKSRAAILDSAAALLRKQGIRGSSVLDVMKGAGLKVSGFYGHFESKEQLFTETLKRAANGMWNRLLTTAKGASSREQALDMLASYLSRSHRDHAEGGCLLSSAAPEVEKAGEPYRSALEEELDGWVRTYAALLGKGAKNRQLAVGMVAMMYGALSLSRAVAGTRLSDEFLKGAKVLGEQAIGPKA